MEIVKPTALLGWTRLHTGTAAAVVLSAYVIFELIDGRIRGRYWQTWIARENNPTGFWLVIGLQGAVIGLCAWAASTYRH